MRLSQLGMNAEEEAKLVALQEYILKLTSSTDRLANL
jgi:hypothetical protein